MNTDLEAVASKAAEKVVDDLFRLDQFLRYAENAGSFELQGLWHRWTEIIKEVLEEELALAQQDDTPPSS